MPKMTEAAVRQAANIQQGLTQSIERVRGNKAMSAQGQQAAIARAYREASQQMKSLGENVAGGAAFTHQELQRQLFGASNLSGADAISVRDAATRAAQLESPSDAEQLLRSAEMTGDDHLARAIAARAFHIAQGDPLTGSQWSGVVDVYADARPGVAEKMNEMLSVQRDDARTRFENALTMALPKPDELDRMHDHQIEQLAQTGPATEA